MGLTGGGPDEADRSWPARTTPIVVGQEHAWTVAGPDGRGWPGQGQHERALDPWPVTGPTAPTDWWAPEAAGWWAPEAAGWAAPRGEAGPWAGPAGGAPWPPPRRRGFLGAGVVLLVAAAIVGALSGAALARRGAAVTAPPSASALPPSRASGGTVTGAAASAIAAKVDPGVVDVMTVLGYQNGAAAGTGMVLTSSGVVLTNNHVVAGATRITVQVNGQGPTYTATVVGTDPSDDVAVLQVQGASGWKTVSTGDSSKVAVGAQVVAIGNALGKGGPPAVTTGQVTALDQSITASDQGGGNAENLTGLVQTDAALQPGDSGGPLVDTAGQVIGMDTAASAGTRFSAASGVAFAIPINHALAVAAQIRAGQGSATVHIGASPFLGVQIQAAGSGAGSSPGAVVGGVEAGTPAAAIGLAAGDSIVSVDGHAVTSPSDLSSQLSPHHPGDSVRIGWVDQNGASHNATVRLATGPVN